MRRVIYWGGIGAAVLILTACTSLSPETVAFIEDQVTKGTLTRESADALLGNETALGTVITSVVTGLSAYALSYFGITRSIRKERGPIDDRNGKPPVGV